MGIKLMVYETNRSQHRQRELFDQGATKLRAVGVHHYGLACDIVRVVNGEPSLEGRFRFSGAARPKQRVDLVRGLGRSSY
jgi:hypothetical protein